jgi:hypothetical protein
MSVVGGEFVCRIPAEGIEGLVEAFADALESGVEVEKLDGLSAAMSAESMLVTVPVTDRRATLEQQQNSLRQWHANAVRQSERAATMADADRWADKSAEYAKELEAVAQELADLDVRHPAASLGEAFEGEVDYLLNAVRNMVGSERHERSLLHQLDAIVHDVQVNVLPDARVEWQAVVRLPVDGGVASVGPVRWLTKVQPELSVALQWAACEAAGDDAPWRRQPQPPRSVPQTRATLSQSAREYRRGDRTRNMAGRDMFLEAFEEVGLSRTAGMKALASPLTPVPYVLLAAARGEEAPDWVPEAWASPEWMGHLHRVYSSDEVRHGNKGKWGTASWLRQACVDVTIAAGGSISVADLLAELELQKLVQTELVRITKSEGAVGKWGSSIRPWRVPLDRWGRWPSHGRSKIDLRGLGVESINCHVCGDVVDHAVRVIDIDGDALCRKGHMSLSDDPQAPPAPLDYLWLRTPERVWRQQRRFRRTAN